MARCDAPHPEDPSRRCILAPGGHADHTDGGAPWTDPEALVRAAVKKATTRRSPKRIADDLRHLAAEGSRGLGEFRTRERAVARDSDPDTSHEAAISVGDLRPNQQVVLGLFREFGPMSHEQLVERAGRERVQQSESGLRTRCEELVRVGLIRDSGAKGRTRHGRQTIIWESAHQTS